MVIYLRHYHNAKELQLIAKHLHYACHRKEYAEAILAPLLHLPLDERGHLRGAGRGVGPL